MLVERDYISSVKNFIFPLIFIVLATASYITRSSVTMATSSSVSRVGHLVTCSFEVFGTVQGVFFRKYTQKQAKTLGIRGWCMNTDYGTVKGQLEGYKEPVEEMQEWLRTTGSPKSSIARVLFSDIDEIPDFTTRTFTIRH